VVEHELALKLIGYAGAVVIFYFVRKMILDK